MFRKIAQSANKSFGSHKYGTLHHSYLATLSESQLRTLLTPIRENEEAGKRLGALAMIECIPDRTVWIELSNEFPIAEDEAWGILANAVALNLFHQSEAATDVRWCKLLHMLTCDRLMMPPDMERQIREFPNRGDMRSVRPSIRAAEMSMREENIYEQQPDRTIPRFPVSEFWNELFFKTKCTPLPLTAEKPQEIDRRAAFDELMELRLELMARFSELTTGSGLYARLDGAFGLVFYSMHLAAESIARRIDTTAHGRFGLRCVVEACITLAYLAKTDSEIIWQQYRNYGSDRSALAFLKLLDTKELPAYVSIDELEELANEDGWFEMRDIDVGNWAKLNLRAQPKTKLSDFSQL